MTGFAEDLGAEAVARVLPPRPVRTYPALLSTHAEALAWARAGASAGAVVVADYQASPRGRAGLVWTVEPGRGLGFSMVLRPALSAHREGWLYTVATCALADELGSGALIEWPDEVFSGGRRWAGVGVHAELGPGERVDWAVVTVLVDDARPPRAPLLASLADRLEATLAADDDDILARHRERCRTLGREVTALLIPMGPAGPQVTGTADGLLADGSLVIQVASDRRIAVPPQNLGLFEDPDPAATGP